MSTLTFKNYTNDIRMQLFINGLRMNNSKMVASAVVMDNAIIDRDSKAHLRNKYKVYNTEVLAIMASLQ
jgi:hypothetical protein